MRVLLGVLVLLLCAFLAHRRSQDWRSDEALWRAATVTAPTLTRPALNLAIALSRTGNDAEAMAWTQRAMRLTEINQSDPSLMCRHLRYLFIMHDTAPPWPSFCGVLW